MKKYFFVLVLFASTFLLSQSNAVTESWLVDKTYTNGKVHKLAVGKNTYEAFVVSLLFLAEELQHSEQEIKSDVSSLSKMAATYSFGKTTIQYLKKSFKEQVGEKDSIRFNSTQTASIKIQYADGKRNAVIKYFDEVSEDASDETFSLTQYSLHANNERSLVYDFHNMNFTDLLNDLSTEGVEVHFLQQHDMTFSLITYPLSKVRK